TYANIHRSIYSTSEKATTLYEQARTSVAQFIGAQPDEIVFTRNTTESINLVASTWGMCDIQAGDHIVITELEHHSNLLPWQLLAYKQEAQLCYIPVTAQGTLDMAACTTTITPKTKLVSVGHVSNAL